MLTHSVGIKTKFLPCTDTKGSRIKAQFLDDKASVTIPFPHELWGAKAHHAAAEALMEKWGGGYTLSDIVLCAFDGYVFVAQRSK